MKCWKPRSTNSKWRWIYLDGDASVQNYEFDGFAHALYTSDDLWPTNSVSTLFLRKLMENTDFQKQFFNRLEYLLNNSLKMQSSITPFHNLSI